MAKRNKDILYKLEEQTVNTTTGEVVEVNSYKKTRVQSEPEFAKMYLQDIMYLTNLPIKEGTTTARLALLFELVNKMEYKTNEIGISTGERRKIAAKLNLQDSTIKKYILDFEKAKILIKEDIGLYTLNPFFFGKGEWKDIYELRTNIKYDFKNLERTFQIEVKENEQLASQEDTDN